LNESAFSATLRDTAASIKPQTGSPANTRSEYEAATHRTAINVLRYIVPLSFFETEFSSKYTDTRFLSSFSNSVFGVKRIFEFAMELLSAEVLI
jgi:hypothetical protein